jgi:hypothetical protein
LIIGIVAGAVALLCAVGVVVAVAANLLGTNGGVALPTSPPSASGSPAPSATTAPPVADPGPTGETFNMAVGDIVDVTNGTAQWSVQLVTAKWSQGGCDSGSSVVDPVITANVAFDVSDGPASLNPVFDFYYVDDAGTRFAVSGLTDCDKPQLADTFSVPTGQSRTGKVAMVVKSGLAGKLYYRPSAEHLSASWLIAAP